jgi:hypothetical protein
VQIIDENLVKVEFKSVVYIPVSNQYAILDSTRLGTVVIANQCITGQYRKVKPPFVDNFMSTLADPTNVFVPFIPSYILRLSYPSLIRIL